MSRHLIVLILLSVLPFALFSQQSTLHRVPQQFRTIQSAVNAARIGDTVLVDHGVYYENLRIGKNIVLAGRFIMDRDTGHVSRTIIDGSRAKDLNRASTISIFGDTDTNCIVMGLTVRGGEGNVRIDPNTPWAFWRYGGGIDVASRGATVAFNMITGNTLRGDGVIDTVNGGGVFFGSHQQYRGQRYFILHGNTISNNRLDAVCCQGGGIYAYYDGRMTDNLITENTLSSPQYNNGGGICISADPLDPENTTLEVRGNRITGNSAPTGGGIHIYTSGQAQSWGNGYPIVFMTNNVVAGNRASGQGGGIVVSGAKIVLTNNTIADNVAERRAGGISAGGAELILFNNIIWNNRPHSRFFAHNAVHMRNNIFEGSLEGSANLNADPQFVPDDPLYGLSATSPALGSGVHSVVAFGQVYRVPATDMIGQPRTNPLRSNPDMGAVESELGELKEIAGRYARITALLSYEERPPEGQRLSSVVRFIVNDTIQLPHDPSRMAVEIPASAKILFVDFIPLVNKHSRDLLYEHFLEGTERPFFLSRRPFTEELRDLEPGVYKLKIGMSLTPRRRMTESIDTHSLEIRVETPWYKTGFAYAGYGLLALTLLAMIAKARLRKHQREMTLQQEFSRMQIESQEAERKRLSAELHDGLGQNLLLASNELQQYLLQNDGTKEGVKQASQLLKESIRSVRELASNLHPHQLERLGFCAALLAMVEQAAHATGLKVRHHCDKVDDLLPKDAEVQLYRIVQEAVSNIVTHANAKEITLEIWKGPDRIEIVVSDNGRGFDPEQEVRDKRTQGEGGLYGFGLSNMAERARLIGGTMKIESTPESGTSISVSYPLQKKRPWTIPHASS